MIDDENNKLTWKEGLFLALVIAFMIIFIIYVSRPDDRRNCLEKIAIQFCQESCEIIKVSCDGIIPCSIKAMNISSRQKEYINFLPSELRACGYS